MSQCGAMEEAVLPGEVDAIGTQDLGGRGRLCGPHSRLGKLFRLLLSQIDDEVGGPLHVNSMMNRFEKLVSAVGVPTIRFHDLRHTCATLLLAQEVHPKIVQERLGLANTSVTLDRYSHVTMAMQRAAADQLDTALGAIAAEEEAAS